MQNKVIISSSVLDGLLNFSSKEKAVGGFLYGIKVLTSSANSVYISSIEPATTQNQINQLTGNLDSRNNILSLNKINKLIGIYTLNGRNLKINPNLNDIVLSFDQSNLNLSCILIGSENEAMDIVVDDSNNIITYKNYLKSRAFIDYQSICNQKKQIK